MDLERVKRQAHDVWKMSSVNINSRRQMDELAAFLTEHRRHFA